MTYKDFWNEINVFNDDRRRYSAEFPLGLLAGPDGGWGIQRFNEVMYALLREHFPDHVTYQQEHIFKRKIAVWILNICFICFMMYFLKEPLHILGLIVIIFLFLIISCALFLKDAWQFKHKFIYKERTSVSKILIPVLQKQIDEKVEKREEFKKHLAIVNAKDFEPTFHQLDLFNVLDEKFEGNVITSDKKKVENAKRNLNFSINKLSDEIKQFTKEKDFFLQFV